ncbi:hypothetical protein C0992_013180 [Termitomyces sp. T32_za158]|nr:hypothetical protein C0992_013180 [Termitomyces sp. T32_za158]
MSSPSPSKTRWTRMGGIVRRASSVLTAARPNTPSTERDSDTASLKGSVRSLPINQPALHLPKVTPSIPSPIAESPVQATTSRSPITTVEQPPQPTMASEPQTATQEYTPPPLLDSTRSDVGGYTDSTDDLPKSYPIRDPSILPPTSTDGHEPPMPMTEPTTTSGPGESSDSDVLHQPPTIKAPSLHRTDSTDSHKPTAEPLRFIDPNETQVARAPSSEHIESVDSYKPPVVGSSGVGSGGFNDGLGEEATEEFKKQIDKGFPSLPKVETPQHIDPSISLRDESQVAQQMPVPSQAPAAIYNAPEMPTPEPVAHPSVASGYALPPFESGQEVWGEFVHPKVEETKRNINTAVGTRSRSSSIRSVLTNDPFAEPITPVITVYHHDQGTSSALPQLPTSNPYSEAPANDTGVVVMPLRPMHEVIPQRSAYEQSNQTLSNTLTGYHETDERLPLLPQATSSKVASYLQPSAASHNIFNVSPQSGIPPTSIWPAQATHEGPRLREFGWIEYHLPDGIVYYVHPTRRVTADIDLRDERRLDAINAYFERHRDGASAPAGMELWLMEDDANDRRRPLRPLRFLVNHSLKMAAYDQSSTDAETSRRAKKAVEDDRESL